MNRNNDAWDDSLENTSSQVDDDTVEEEFDEFPRKKPVILRILALFILITFVGFITASFLPAFTSNIGNVVKQSLELEKDIDMQRLQRAVVKINVLAREDDAAFTVKQKSGTGFNIDSAGIIVTNYHVIKGVKNMTIKFPNGKVCKALNWSVSPEFDLAIIDIKGNGFPSVPLAGKSPAAGDKVRIVGNPLGLNNIIAEGEVKNYFKLKEKPVKIFSTDAHVYPGNSGSPVFNSAGRVTGVVFGRYERDNGNKEIRGLALPVGAVKKLNDF
ncbi:MAG: serine protease [Clostridiales bacterium]|nr:serine protease [Clostridiales bacterium]MCF8022897.1 serine protease [Clostridiales bacterium]